MADRDHIWADQIGSTRLAWLQEQRDRYELANVAEVMRRLIDIAREQGQEPAPLDDAPTEEAEHSDQGPVETTPIFNFAPPPFGRRRR